MKTSKFSKIILCAKETPFYKTHFCSKPKRFFQTFPPQNWRKKNKKILISDFFFFFYFKKKCMQFLKNSAAGKKIMKFRKNTEIFSGCLKNLEQRVFDEKIWKQFKYYEIWNRENFKFSPTLNLKNWQKSQQPENLAKIHKTRKN